MKVLVVACAVLMVPWVAGLSYASTVADVSPLALPIIVAGGCDCPPPAAPPVYGAAYPYRHPPVYGVIFRPRRGQPPPDPYAPPPSSEPKKKSDDDQPGIRGFSQIHGGAQSIAGVDHPGWLIGYRGGLSFDPNVQIGVQAEWRHRSNTTAVVLSETAGPDGTTLKQKEDLASSLSDLVPLMAVLQIGGSSKRVRPYVGIGGGVEFLHLTAENFQTGSAFDGQFAGLGWQAWGGLTLPLSGSVRINAEAFYNEAVLERDLSDTSNGYPQRETVDISGPGARFGLAWGF